VGLLIATPIFGYLTDRFGRKWPLLSGLLLMVVACFGFAYASTYWQLLLSRFAQGFSGAASWVIGLVMIADVYPLTEVGVAMGTVMALNSIGFLIGPTIGGVMYDGLGFRASFLLCAGLAFLDFLVRVFFITDEALQRMYIQATEANRAAGLSLALPIAVASENKQPQTVVIDVPVADVSVESPLDTPFSHVPTVTYGSQSPSAAVSADVNQPQIAVVKLTLLDLLRDRSFLILSYCTAVMGIFFGGLEPIWALHLQTAFNCSPTQIGLLFLVVVVPNALGSVGVGYLADRYSKKWLIGIGTLLLAASIPLLAIFQRDGQLLYFALMLSVVGTTASIPITPILPLLSAMITAKNSRSFGSVYRCTFSFSSTIFAYPFFHVFLCLVAARGSFLTLLAPWRGR
jgi:multidrug resistance protein